MDLKKRLRAELSITDTNINLSSNIQLSKILKERGWPEIELTKNKDYVLNDDTLGRYVKMGYHEAKTIQELHSLETIHNTFVGYPCFKDSGDIDIFDKLDEILEENENDTQAFNDFVFPEKLDMSKIVLGKGTGYWQHLKKVGRGKYKVFPSFSSCLANSHRNKHRRPNLANLPARGPYALKIRGQFTTPSKDYVWVSADQSGLQLRNIAFLLEEGSPMRKAFLELGGDIHSMTGATVINNNKIPVDEFISRKKEKEIGLIRYKAKGMNFGCAFNAQEFTVKSTVIEPNWTLDECKDFIIEEGLDIVGNDEYLTVAREMRKRHFKGYWGLDKYNKATIKQAKKDGFVRSSYGSFRRLPYLLVEVGSSGDRLDKKRYANYTSIALNSRIQTLETVVMNRTLNKTIKDSKEHMVRAYIPDFIHDALECICHKDDLISFCTIMKAHAETMYPEFNGIPLEMEGNVADYHGTFHQTKLNEKGEEENAWEVWDMGHDWDKYIDKDLYKKIRRDIV